MFLGSLRIRGKLTLLVVLPLLMMVGLVMPVLQGLITDASKATDIDAVATVTGRVGPLVEDLQRERLLSVGYLVGMVTEDELELQSATVTDRVRDLQRELGDSLPAEVRERIGLIAGLNPLRERVRAREATPYQVFDEYAPLVDGIIEALGVIERADPGTEVGRQLIALDALLRLNESSTISVALLAVMSDGTIGPGAARYRDERVRLNTYRSRFTGFATRQQIEVFTLVSEAFFKRVGGPDFDTRFESDPATTMAALPKADLFPALRSFSALGGFATKRLVDDVATLATEQRRQQLTFAYVIGALVVIVLLGVLALVAMVARAVAVPLTQLSRAAERVAEAGEQELLRVADDESEHVEPVRFDVLELASKDEIGDLARVFERVQNTAFQLVERQVLSRRNVAEMFGHIGRRTQNLVGGQVDLIDELEHQETDSDRLAKLYRLDHIANRLRRSADSLVVISGAERDETRHAPLQLIDVARLALAEIEEYTRVDLDIPLDLRLAPAIVNDMVLICGELLENATSFSPPHTRVTVGAWSVPGGVRLVVTDRGIGMPDERLAEENARLALRERLDLVPTQVLGLFVVGRLARRHRLTIALSHTAGGGVTVDVGIRDELLVPEHSVVPESRPEPVAVSAPRRVAGQSAAGFPEAGFPVAVHPAAGFPAAERPTNVRTALSRAKDAIGENRPWNAFGMPQGFPQAGPQGITQGGPQGFLQGGPQGMAQGGPQGFLQGGPQGMAQGGPQGMAQGGPQGFLQGGPQGMAQGGPQGITQGGPQGFQQGGPQSAPVSPNTPATGLRQRVPGATLSPQDTSPARARPMIEHDPDAARSLVEAFESGVTRALYEA